MKKNKEITFFSLALIIFIEQIFRVVQGNIDILVLGRVSNDAVATVGLINQIMALNLVIIGIAVLGTNILFSYYYGEKNYLKMSAIMSNGMMVVGIISTALTILLIIFSQDILRMMGLEDSLIKLGQTFFIILAFSIPIQGINSIFLVYLRNIQKGRLIISSLMLGTILNLCGNIASLYLFDSIQQILTAVAIMTVLSYLIPCCIYAFFIAKSEMVRLKFSSVHLAYMKEIIHLGGPTAVEQFSYMIFQVFLSWIVLAWGIGQFQAKTYVQSWSEFTFIFTVTIGQATQILLGQRLGAHKTEEVVPTVFKSIMINSTIAVCLSIVLYRFHGLFIEFYNISSNTAILIGSMLFITIFLEPFRAINVNLISSLYALKDTKFLFISIFSLWGIVVPIIFIFKDELTIVNIWMIVVGDEVFRSVLFFFRWKQQLKVKLGIHVISFK